MGDPFEVINDWGLIQTTLRTRASGKQRVTIDVKSEAVVINTDPAYWVQSVADAIAKAFQHALMDIRTTVSDETALSGIYKSTAFARGKRWAMKRYAGGKIGGMAPSHSPAGRSLLDDSGRLIRSIVARFAKKTEITGTAVINVAANRLDEPEVRARVLAIMYQHIPFVRDPTLLGAVALVKAAIEGVVAGAVKKTDTSALDALKASWQAAKTAAGLADEFTSEEPAPEE